MNILIVKLTSLGDVLHGLPVVWDLRAAFPDATIDWVTEESYVQMLEPLRQLDGAPGLDRIIPVAFRRWRKTPRGTALSELRAFLRNLRAREYDYIADTQGLIKSALVTRLARRRAGAVVAGFANRTRYSGFEPMARCFYTRKVEVPFEYHAVERARCVAMAGAGRRAPDPGGDPPKFYPAAFVDALRGEALMPEPYALCFHSTAQEAKRWAAAHWVAVGRALRERGLTPVFPWGTVAERAISESLAAQVPGAVVPAGFSMRQAFGIIAGARIVVGVDTGLIHVAAALGRPTVEIYCASWRLNAEGYWSDRIRNLGERGSPPGLDSVLEAVAALLALPDQPAR